MLILAAAGACAAGPLGTAQATGPQPPDCPLFAPRTAVERAFALADGTRVVARDPYGGLLPRNRLFFAFGLRAPAGKVASVSWALDGVVKRVDDRAPFAWSRQSGSTQMPAGDHTVTVTATPAGGGAPAAIQFPLTATDCQPAFAAAFIGEILIGASRPGSFLSAESAFESGEGPALRAVTFTGTGIDARIPTRARGRAAGTVALSRSAVERPRELTLRVPRRGSTLLRRGGVRVVLRAGARGFLRVTGLPAGTRSIRLRLEGAGGRRLLRPRRISPGRCRYAVAAIVSSADATIRVPGDAVSGRCPRS